MTAVFFAGPFVASYSYNAASEERVNISNGVVDADVHKFSTQETLA